MFAITFWCLLFLSYTVASPLQPSTPTQLKASSLDVDAPISVGLNAFQCFNPSFPPPGPFYPIKYSECIDAADQIVSNKRADAPSTFSRGENADIRLPWRARGGNYVMTLDVVNDDDDDIMRIQEARGIALALCRMCVGGYYRYGGRTPVGPRGVVFISVYGTAPLAVNAAGPATPQPSRVILRQIAPRISSRNPRLLNISSLAPANAFDLNDSNADEGECFSESGPSPRRPLYPVKSLDCFTAADELIRNRQVDIEMTFGQRAGVDFRLPWSAQSQSCIVTVDTRDYINFDTLTLREVHETAVDRIEKCTMGDNIFGGRRAVGLMGIVNVYVFGRSPHQMPESDISAPTRLVARAQSKSSALSLLNTSGSQTTGPPNVTRVLTTTPSSIRSMPECFGPPLPRERAVPITNFGDCEAATAEIVGTRPRSQTYVFSRTPSADPRHFQLPASFRVGTCKVHLDMEAKGQEDAVRLGYVESTAWVLAHKCSGLEVAEARWGGTMTVSVGARDLIRVWVYGVPPVGNGRRRGASAGAGRGGAAAEWQ